MSSYFLLEEAGLNFILLTPACFPNDFLPRNMETTNYSLLSNISENAEYPAMKLVRISSCIHW